MPQRPSPPELLDGWTAVDRYFESAVGAEDPVLQRVREASARAGLPDIAVSPLQGRALTLLARFGACRRILEIGTLGGYSAICLGRALPPDGRLLSLELQPLHARVARENLAAAGLADRVEVRIGPALDSLARLGSPDGVPFDLVFIDADKPRYPEYLDWGLRLARPGALLIVDNVARRGDVADATSSDPQVLGVQRMNASLREDPRVFATALQTVGSKGHDGWLLAWARPGPPTERAA